MNTPFIPIQGKRDTIQDQAIVAGNLYFATDTGEMFLDTATERINVGGGGVAVLYAKQKDVTQDLTDMSYVIYFSELEDQDAAPKKDDLIINSNGTFYKIISYKKATGIIKCSRIAVSGTGGGGGGNTPGGGDTPGKYIDLTCVGTAPNAQTYIFGQKTEISFAVEASHDAILTVNYHVTNVATGNTQTFTYTVDSGDTHVFDLGSVIQKGQNTLMVEAIGSNSGEPGVLTYTSINCIELALKESSNFNPLVYAYNADMSFHFIPVGTIAKTLLVYINGNLEVEKPLMATDNEQSMSVTIPKKPHGVYELKAVLAYNSGAKTITTDPLEYQIAFLGENNSTPLVWFNKVPKEIVDHDKLNIEYMVYDPSSPDRTTVRRYINNKEIASLDNIAYSSTKWLNWNVSNYELGDNEFVLQCGTSPYKVKVFVKADELRNLDVLTTDLYVNLVSTGRSNSENETQRQEWYFERSNGEKSIVKFNNFNWYNNGWINDAATGDSMLRISNGASIEVPLNLMNTTALSTNLTFEIQFRLRNVQKYENLIEVTSEEIKDPVTGETTEVKVTKTVRSTDGVWCRYYGNDIGMCLGTQEGFFKSKQVISSGRYKEDDLVTVSFVIEKASDTNPYPLIYMYINGIMSAIVNYDKTSDSFASSVKTMTINSDYCDVDIYKIRVYQAALSSSDIVHNYIADQNSATLYDMNQIVEFKNNIPSISYTKMKDYNAAHPDSPLQAYAVLECVDKTEDLLPYVKGGKKKVNVEFVNPSLEYAYKQKQITDEQYLRGCPSFNATAVEFDVQGTSSQGYPRRNYKGKFKKSDSWTYADGPLKGKSLLEDNVVNGVTFNGYYMDNHYSETTFTWKADYMESSMTHNTGYASFVNTLYSKHPLQDYDPEIDVTDRRTTIYGFPMIVFQKKADGSYEFIGRYNFNFDKGADNVIGFKDGHDHPVVTGKTFKKVAECWELCNNQGGRTSFKITDFEELDDDGKLAVLNDFEYRYHPDADDIDNALDKKDKFANQSQTEINTYLLSKYENLRLVAEWLKSTDSLQATNAELDPSQYLTVDGTTYTTDSADYRIKKFAKEFDKWFDQEYCAIYFIMTEMLLLYDSRGKNMMLASWGPKEEGGNYIWYPIFYDIDTQLGVNNSGVPSWEYYTEPSPFDGAGVFSTADSVLWYNFEKCFLDTAKTYYRDIRKNGLTYEKLKGYYDYDPKVSLSYAMMGHRPVNIINVDQYWKYIAPTFGGYINTSGQIAKDEGKRFYCLQGDRQLHRDLFLRNRFNFLDSKWLGGAYSVNNVPSELWVRANANNYPLTSDKYLDRTLTDDEAAQGYEQKTWKENNLDADLTFKVTPYLQQYTSLWFDDTLMAQPVKWDGINPNVMTVNPTKQIAVKESRPLTQQIFYVGGGQYISSLGDLSRAYLDEVILSSLKRLKDLHLGSDDPGYYNSQPIKTFTLGAEAFDTDGNPNTNAKTLLESVVLTNVTSLGGPMNVTGAEKLKEFRALGTKITGVTFADGGQMEVIHLPDSIAHLTFVEPVSLRGLITSTDNFKDADGKFNKGLYVPGVTTTGNLADTTDIAKLQVVGGNMGYSSYQLMKNLIDIKTTMQGKSDIDELKKTIQISLENVLWSPYKLIEAGVAYDAKKTYAKKTDNSTFEAYANPSAEQWAADTLNALIYEVLADNLQEKSCLTNLDVIKMFIGAANIGTPTTDEEGKVHYPIAGEDVPNYFRDVTEYADGRTTYPYLSGDIFIDNSAQTADAISEFEIKQIKEKYYPDLNIFVAKVDPAYTLRMVEVINDEEAGTKQIVELQTVKYDKSSTKPISMSDITVTPSRLHHYFKGWSLSENGDILTDSDIEALTFSASKMTYTLYAVYDWDSYIAYFYNGNDQVGATEPVVYGEPFYEVAEIPDRAADEAALPLTQRIAFYGWSDKYQANPIIATEDAAKKLIVDVTSFKAMEDKAFYAIFVQEDVYSKPTDDKYFTYSRSTVTKFGVEGYTISANSDYLLKGKITIPATHNGKPIVGMESFSNALGATGIFFMDGSQLKEVGDYAFSTEGGSPQLKGIYLPDSVVRIGTYAFNNVSSLEHASEHYAKTGADGDLPSNLERLGDRAFAMNQATGKLHLKNLPQSLKEFEGERTFYKCGPNVHITSLPINVPRLAIFSFAGCTNIRITEFGSKSGTVGASTPLTSIGQSAFEMYSAGAHSNIEFIYIWDSVDSIAMNAFKGYGKTGGVTVLTNKESHDWDPAYIGVAKIEQYSEPI